MKANKAKSKFVYPDKLYARCKDNKTLDISYAPQNMDAVEYTRTDALIEKVCNLLSRMVWEVTYEDLEGDSVEHYDKTEFIEEIRKYMKGE